MNRATSGRLSEPPRTGPGAATAWALSLAGVLPFALAAAFVIVAGRQSLWFDWFVDVARTYGAVILSFVGGIRWGAALQPAAFGVDRAPAGRIFALSVLPSLAGWLALVMEPVFGLPFLAAAFALQGVWDAYSGPPAFGAAGGARAGTRAGSLPLWFVRLRVTITLLVVLCLLATFVAVA